MSRKPIFPGSFDPPTLGHVDLIERACAVFGELTVAVGANSQKSGLFSVDERLEMLREICRDLPVEVKSYTGLLVEECRAAGHEVVVRGLRSATDFAYECDLGLTNKVLAPEVETVFLLSDQRYAFVSSRLIKEIVLHGGSASAFLFPAIEKRLRAKLRSSNQETRP